VDDHAPVLLPGFIAAWRSLTQYTRPDGVKTMERFLLQMWALYLSLAMPPA